MSAAVYCLGILIKNTRIRVGDNSMEGLRCLFIILNLICESPDAEKIYSSELQINDLQGDFHFHCAFYFRILSNFDK